MKKKLLPIIVVITFFVMQMAALQHNYSVQHSDHPACEMCHLLGQMGTLDAVASFSFNLIGFGYDVVSIKIEKPIYAKSNFPYFPNAPPSLS